MLRTAGFPVNKLVYCQPIKIQPLRHTARERISTASGYLMLFGLNLQFVLEGQRDSGRFMFRRCVGPLSDLWYLNRSRFHFEQFLRPMCTVVTPMNPNITSLRLGMHRQLRSTESDIPFSRAVASLTGLAVADWVGAALEFLEAL